MEAFITSFLTTGPIRIPAYCNIIITVIRLYRVATLRLPLTISCIIVESFYRKVLNVYSAPCTCSRLIIADLRRYFPIAASRVAKRGRVRNENGMPGGILRLSRERAVETGTRRIGAQRSSVLGRKTKY